MTAIPTAFFAVMGVAAVTALVVLLVQDFRDLGEPFDFDFDAPELPPCGMRLVLTEEQVEASFAEIEKNFSVKPRENR